MKLRNVDGNENGIWLFTLEGVYDVSHDGCGDMFIIDDNGDPAYIEATKCGKFWVIAGYEEQGKFIEVE